MAAGSVVLGSATFLVAVSGLLAPPLHPPRRCSPSFPRAVISAPGKSPRSSTPKHRASTLAAWNTHPALRRKIINRSAHEGGGVEGIETDPRRGRSGSMGFESFDAGAWKNIPSSPAPTVVPSSPNPTAAPAARKASPPSRHPDHSRQARTAQGGGESDMDVDVEKLPTFVFFGRGADGNLWREDVVGGGDARSCAAQLQDKFASLWPLGAAGTRSSSSWRQVPSGTRGGEGIVAGNSVGLVGSASIGSYAGRDSGADNGTGSGIGSDSTNGVVGGSSRNAFEDISSREDLLGVLGSLKNEQGLVVVMYHARWCRKCAYLTPVFRRLAAAASSGAEAEAAGGLAAVICGDEGGGTDSSSGVSQGRAIFCRVDVSDLSWGRRRTANGATADTAAARAWSGNAASAASAADTDGLQQHSLESHEVGELDAALSAASAPVSDGTNAGAEEAADGGMVETNLSSLHAGSPALENCDTCGRSGFVPCGECEGRGAVTRSSPDGKHTMAVTCPACVGYKRLRCPTCGGKCYMCE